MILTGKTAEEVRNNLRSKHKLGAKARVGVKAPIPLEQRFDSANREFVIVVNTADVDLEDEVVIPTGCLPENGGSFDYIQRNAKAPWGHDYFGPAVASIRRTKLVQDKTAWLQRFKVPNVGMGASILAMAEDGLLPASSVGFRAIDFGALTKEEMEEHGKAALSIIRIWNWFETSLTHFPMNVFAQAVGLVDLAIESVHESEKSIERRHSVIDHLSRGVATGRISQKAACSLGMPTRKYVSIAGGKTIRIDRDAIQIGREPIRLAN